VKQIKFQFHSCERKQWFATFVFSAAAAGAVVYLMYVLGRRRAGWRSFGSSSSPRRSMVKIDRRGRVAARRALKRAGRGGHNQKLKELAADWDMSTKGLAKALAVPERTRDRQVETRGRRPALTRSDLKRAENVITAMKKKRLRLTRSKVKQRANLKVSLPVVAGILKNLTKPRKWTPRRSKPCQTKERQVLRFDFGKKLPNGNYHRDIDMHVDNYSKGVPLADVVRRSTHDWLTEDEVLDPSEVQHGHNYQSPKAHLHYGFFPYGKNGDPRNGFGEIAFSVAHGPHTTANALDMSAHVRNRRCAQPLNWIDM